MSKGKTLRIAAASRKARKTTEKAENGQQETTDVLDFGLVIKARLGGARNRLKEKLLAGARVEPGRLVAELRLLPGRSPVSTNPDDYELLLSRLQ